MTLREKLLHIEKSTESLPIPAYCIHWWKTVSHANMEVKHGIRYLTGYMACEFTEEELEKYKARYELEKPS